MNDYVLERAEKVVEEIHAAGGKALAVQADVTNLESVKAAVAKTEEKFGKVGVLVNNAGNAGATPHADTRKPFWETGPDAWNSFIGVNFYGVVNCTSACVPSMIGRGAPGRIITIISEASRYGDSGLEVYAGAKAGAAGFHARHGADIEAIPDHRQLRGDRRDADARYRGASQGRPGAVQEDDEQLCHSATGPAHRYCQHGSVPRIRRQQLGDGADVRRQRRLHVRSVKEERMYGSLSAGIDRTPWPHLGRHDQPTRSQERFR